MNYQLIDGIIIIFLAVCLLNSLAAIGRLKRRNAYLHSKLLKNTMENEKNQHLNNIIVTNPKIVTKCSI